MRNTENCHSALPHVRIYGVKVGQSRVARMGIQDRQHVDGADQTSNALTLTSEGRGMHANQSGLHAES